MNIITDNAVLAAYIPNVVTSCEGESSLFEKLAPMLKVAELWFCRKVCGIPALVNEDAMHMARSIVACEAFRMAVPSLNVILTANGFGIVSNNTTAPASKERTESLVEALVEQRDNAIEQLVFLLDGTGTQFKHTVFQGFDAQKMQGLTSHLMDKFTEQRSAVFRLQTTLAEEVLSDEVLGQMTSETYYDESERTNGIAHLFQYVPGIIVKQLQGEDCKDDIKRVVNYLRTHPALFPHWADSSAAEHWRDYTYQNDKSKGGYWL